MPSLFYGKTALRHKYVDISFSAIASATDASTSVLFCRFDTNARLAYIFNSMDQDVTLYLVHPDADSTVAANRLKWMEFPKTYNLNYDNFSANLEIDPGAKVFISRAGTAPSSGKFRILYWG